MASSSSSRNWVFDVFPSFNGEDVRKGFISYLLRELDRKLIISFIDNKIERSQSLDPELKQAIMTSRIAVVVFSKNYASSSWCLNELLEIVKCKKELGQTVIPIFYDVDPTHIRKQRGEFGKVFAKTCQTKTKEERQRWGQALTNVANILGYHTQKWPSEAKMTEAIANDVLGKLMLTPMKDFEGFVGLEDHIAKMSVLLNLELEEVRMIGIWGSSGIGKTTIGRALYSRLCHRFQSSIFIDKAFVSKSMEIYNSANQDDYNMKMHLQKTFLSEILDKKDIKIGHLGAVEERLKNHKVLIFIDDLDDQVVLDTLVGQTQWFGCGSRIIVITKDKHFLRAHGVDHIYEVSLPSKELAFKMFCLSAFRKNSPPDGLMELASEVSLRAGNLPLGINVLGSYLRGRNKEDWMDLLSSLRNRLNGKIERTLRVSYDGLNNKNDEAIFRHIACLFNGEKLKDIKLLLADSDLDVNIGFKNLIDKSLIHIRRGNVDMHRLLQDMGKEIVRAQSNKPGKREFLVDSKDICDLLEDNTGTQKVLGIALDLKEIDELHIHENAFKGMRNLLFLKIETKKELNILEHAFKWDEKEEVRWHLPEGFQYFPDKLRFLRLEGYPLIYMPSNFCPENLVKLQMPGSKLERLWEGVPKLRGLKEIHLQRSINLKEIPDLSMATNLKTLDLSDCSSLEELPPSIQHLNKLKKLIMSRCINLETLPTGMNLQSLSRLDLSRCSRLKNFPDISTNILELVLDDTSIDEFLSILRLKKLTILSMCRMKSDKLWESVQPLTPFMSVLSLTLKKLYLWDIPSLVELPSSIQNFRKLEMLGIKQCINLETLPTGINLQSLDRLDLVGCSRLKSFPDISTNVLELFLSHTGIQVVPWWIKDFSRLDCLYMRGCTNLLRVSLNLFKVKHLAHADFSFCGALSEACWDDSASVTMKTENIHSRLLDEPYCSVPKAMLDYTKCFNLDKELLIQQKIYFRHLFLPGEEVPSYFTHRSTGTSLTNIPHLFQTPPFQQICRSRVCVVVDSRSIVKGNYSFDIKICCRFIDRLGGHIDSVDMSQNFSIPLKGGHLIIFDTSFIFNYLFPPNRDNDPLDELYYDLDIQFYIISSSISTLKLKACGIRLSVDSDTD